MGFFYVVENKERFSDAVDAKLASVHIDDVKVEKEYNCGRVQSPSVKLMTNPP